jgi:hypothetical protein
MNEGKQVSHRKPSSATFQALSSLVADAGDVIGCFFLGQRRGVQLQPTSETPVVAQSQGLSICSEELLCVEWRDWLSSKQRIQVVDVKIWAQHGGTAALIYIGLRS